MKNLGIHLLTKVRHRIPPGMTLKIQSHRPPEPFGPDYNARKPRGAVPRWYPSGNRIRVALDFPPVSTRPVKKFKEHTLTITGDKNAYRFDPENYDGGPHVVTCYLDNKPSKEYIAKIYDGVDYPMREDPWCDERKYIECMDCMSRADCDYSIEAHAYKDLKGTAEGVLVPKFKGSWTFSLETGSSSEPRRWVRMILLKLVKGGTVQEMISRGALPDESKRLSVLRQTIEAHNKLWWNSRITVNKVFCISPKDVIIGKDWSIKLIGFRRAKLWRYTTYRAHPKDCDGHPEKPESPISRYWPSSREGENFFGEYGTWRDWIPKPWITDKKLAVEWLVNTFGDSPDYRQPGHEFFEGYGVRKSSPATRLLLEDLKRRLNINYENDTFDKEKDAAVEDKATVDKEEDTTDEEEDTTDEESDITDEEMDPDNEDNDDNGPPCKKQRFSSPEE
ncbi:hypothetical protein B0T21DRAFT_131623 [Apiosordaria backusii]|uniref:Uncharacterized protein n=1 Tax=Apiosordaria backusii TaxID=314023 RepID=A0AA40ENC9_9PEZI|nr:hypothetical protein B0T21DRAFT_131623 [Apiosordaria backusii]